MSITRLQQARQLYAMGQRVAKTLDGSRPGYRGDDAYGGGRDTGNTASDTGPGGGATDIGPSHTGDTIGNRSNPHTDSGMSYDTYVSPSRIAVSPQFTQAGINTFNKNLKGPTFGDNLVSGINNLVTNVKDFYTDGGVLGLGVRGLNSLLGSVFGPRYDTSNREKAIMNQFLGPGGSTKSIGNNQTPVDGGGGDGGGKDYSTIPALYSGDETIEDIDGDGILSLQDIVLRFQGADRTLNPEAAGFQDTDALRAAIMERAKNLYT